MIVRKWVTMMNMQELKQMIYKGEKVDVECKKAENSVPKSAYESYSAFANTKVDISFLEWMKIKRKIRRKKDLLYRE